MDNWIMKNIVADKKTISLIDLSGRKIKQWNLPNNEKEYQLSLVDIASGCYFLNTTNGNNLFSGKIIKL